MSFDALAPHYRWLEFAFAGNQLQCCRTAFFDQIPRAQNILLLGEGHGRCLVECRRRFAHARITCMDISGPMLAQSRRQLARRGLESDRVDFIQADILTWTPPAEAYDLIITHFLLDCFSADEVETILRTYAASAAPNAIWLVADFQIPAAGLKRLRNRFVLWVVYRFFQVTARLPVNTLTEPDAYFARAGFNLRRRKEAGWGLLRSDWWQR